MWYRPQYNKWRYEKDADTNLYPPDAIQTVYQRGLSEGRKQGLREAVEIVKRESWKPHGNSDKKWLTEKEIIEAIEAAMKEGK